MLWLESSDHKAKPSPLGNMRYQQRNLHPTTFSPDCENLFKPSAFQLSEVQKHGIVSMPNLFVAIYKLAE